MGDGGLSGYHPAAAPEAQMMLAGIVGDEQ
jgi:hypothetical protein